MRRHGSERFLVEVAESVRKNIGVTCQLNPVGVWPLSEISGKISIGHVTRYNEGGIRSQGSAVKWENVIVGKCTPYSDFVQKHLGDQGQLT